MNLKLKVKLNNFFELNRSQKMVPGFFDLFNKLMRFLLLAML